MVRNVVPAGDSRRRGFAPHLPQSVERAALPYAGPRTRAEWDAAIAEMVANDETFREWRSSEISAELTAKTVAAQTAIARDEESSFEVERVA